MRRACEGRRDLHIKEGWHKVGLGAMRAPTTYQDMQQFFQVAADDILVLIQRPAALLGIILSSSQVCEDHLESLLVMADLS